MVFQQYGAGSSNSYCVASQFVGGWIIPATCSCSLWGSSVLPSDVSGTGGSKGQKSRVELGENQIHTFVTSLMLFVSLSSFLRIKPRAGGSKHAGGWRTQGPLLSCSRTWGFSGGAFWKETCSSSGSWWQPLPTQGLREADWFYGRR